MKYDSVIKNGKIVNSKTIFEGELCIKDGKIVAITAHGVGNEADLIVDAMGRYVMPGVIDPHLHGGHGTPNRETFECASRAAAAGGITTVLEQPLSEPSTVTVQAWLDKKVEADKKFVIDFGIWGGMVPGHLDEMEGCYKHGAGAFKSFMCPCSNYPMTNDGILLEGMKMLKKFGGLSAVHAENDTLINELVNKFNAEGKTDVYAFIKSHPPYSEMEAILRYIFLARIAGCKSHVVHCSVPDGIRAIHQARLEGVDITVETSPHYLSLCEDDLIRLGGVCKCDPPVRSRELMEDLWDCLLAGMVDMIASDHSPHPIDRKVVAQDNFPHASEGVTSLETMLPVILDEGVAKRGMKLTQVAQLLSENIAKRFGLWGRKGALAIGFDADYNIVDMHRTWLCKAEQMHYLNKHTPFDGRTFQGSIDETYVRGTLVSKDRDIKVEPGFGKFYKMIMD